MPTGVDNFRPLEELFTPDPRQTRYVVLDANGTRPATIQDRYTSAASLILYASVPDEIAAQFNTAKELLVYSWFNLRHAQIAERHGYSTLEMALRLRLKAELEAREKRWKTRQIARAKQNGKKPKGDEPPPTSLATLLQMALDEQLICDEHMAEYRRHRTQQAEYFNAMSRFVGPDPRYVQPPATRDTYVRNLVKAIPSLRNHLAHGSQSIYPGAYLHLELCCDMINQLYSKTKP